MSEANASRRGVAFSTWEELDAHMAESAARARAVERELRDAENHLSDAEFFHRYDAGVRRNDAENRLNNANTSASQRAEGTLDDTVSDESSSPEHQPPAYTAGSFVQVPPPAYTPDPLGRFDDINGTTANSGRRPRRRGVAQTITEIYRAAADDARARLRDIEAAAPRRTATSQHTTTTAVVMTTPRARVLRRPQQVLLIVVLIFAFLPSIMLAWYYAW